MIRKVDSPEIVYLKNNDHVLSTIIDKIGDLEYELYEDPYRFLVFTIIGQMLSNEIGEKLYKRLEALCLEKITPCTINNLSDEELISIGISKRKAEAIKLLTNRVLDNKLFLHSLETKTNQEIIDTICSIQGIGPWTAKMLLIFVLDRMDVLPYEDGAFIAAFSMVYKIEDNTRDRRIVRKQCKKWKPYSSLAARYLYRFYDSELKYKK